MEAYTFKECDFIVHNLLSRQVVVSREAMKKQHACLSSGLHDHYSELFTWIAALKFIILYLSPYSRYCLEMIYPQELASQRSCKSAPQLLLISHS